MEFHAAVLTAVGAPLAAEPVALTEIRSGDVLIRNRASGLCHTDLEVMQGSLSYPLPIVLGHEGAGVVEAVGDGVTRVKPGDHVVASWNPFCGDCFYCLRGTPILCEPFTRHQPAGSMLDGSSRLAWNGKRLNHYSVVSSHAEYSIVPESGAIKVPDAIPFDRACLIGCAVMTGVGAVSRLAQVEAGARVAVIGCGAVGLNVVQAAALEQAAQIIVVDRDADRLSTAQGMGATTTLVASDTTVGEAKELTDGRGADYVFECAGSEQALRVALDVTRPGGQLVILGKTNVEHDVRLRFGSLMGEKQITRSSYGGARPRRDFPWIAQLYLDGKLDLDTMISTQLPLDRINDGFDAMRRGEGVRHVVTFD